jgi:hypothetical protein
MLHPKIPNTNLHNVTHSLISWNPREPMFAVPISLLIVAFLSLISQNLSLMQTTKEVNPHPHIVPCVNLWSATFFVFFFLCHLLNVDACICHITREGQVKWTTPQHTIKMLHFVLLHNVTCYIDFIVPHTMLNTTKLHNITHTLVAAGVILQSSRYLRLMAPLPSPPTGFEVPPGEPTTLSLPYMCQYKSG